MNDCHADKETQNAPADDRTVPLHHELGPILYADAIEALRMAEGDLGIFISESLLFASTLKKKVDPDAPVPDWLQ